MKKIRGIVSLIMVCLLAALSAGGTAYAEVKEQSLFYLKESQDVTVTVTYETNDVSLELVAPSGQIITKDTKIELITVLSGKTATIFFIGQAEEGQWKLKYDKGSNESISVSADVQDSSFYITEYKVGTLGDEHIPVDFLVSGKDRTRYNYKLSLTTDRESLTGKEIVSGWGYTGETVAVSLPMDEVSSYDKYYLLLYVSYDLNGAEIFDYRYSEEFAYTNPAAPEMLENVDVVIEHDLNNIELNWKNYLPRGTESIYVAVYKGEEEILSGEYPTADGYSLDIPYDDQDVLRVELSYRNRKGLVSERFIKEIRTTEELLLLPESSLVNSDRWIIGYRNANQAEVEVWLNNKKQTLSLQGSGTEYIALTEERNDIVLIYQDADGNTHKYQRIANVSMIVPEIELLRHIDGVTTGKKAIMISGTTNADALTVNGETVVVEKGYFHYSYPLVKGGNNIVLEAALGNSITRVNAFVVRTETPVFPVVYLVAGLLVSAAGIVVLCLRMKKENSAVSPDEKKGRRKYLVLLVFGWLAAVAAFAGFAVVKYYTGTSAYLELAYESMKKANQLLNLERCCMWTAIVCSALSLLGTIAYAVIGVLHRRREENVDETAE